MNLSRVIGLFPSLYAFVILYRLVGVGEASFVSLAAPFIDDNAPASQVCLCNQTVIKNILALSSFWCKYLSRTRTRNVYTRKQRGSQYFTCVYHWDMQLAISMVVW